MRLLPYTKRAIQYGVVSMLLCALTVFIGKLISPDAVFNGDVKGSPYTAAALTAMLAIGLLAIVTLCVSIFYAITSEANRWK